MFKIETLMVLIPALPLLAALLNACCGKKWLKDNAHVPVILALSASFVCSLLLLSEVRKLEPQGDKGVGVEKIVTLWTWAAVDEAGPRVGDAPRADLQLDIALRADPLTSMMLPMVLFIATLVAIYAIGYMHDDPGYWRFYTYVPLFVFSMTMLVSVSSFALLYVFWEAVGVCSYLLIGFWFEKPEAAAAGKKAFLVNRIGDFGFALAVFLIWVTYGTLNFHDTNGVSGVLGQIGLADKSHFDTGVALLIALGLFIGACGKSAQFPLHVWLPDAMEGPTPVSALIHAATMVTAGVYLVARCAPLFVLNETALLVVAAIGGFTALLAGLIALTQHDLKRVLAYSTVSQLGYMFLALGTGTVGGIIAGMFHLFTHAFFKALLFLGAGSVMHAMGHVIDMRRFSGLRHVMPWTHRTFWFGSLALAGVFPFAGFWSKDLILAELYGKAHDGAALYGYLYYGALITAFLTAFYTFRALFRTFFGEQVIPTEAGHHAHESPPVMIFPLVLLALASALVGVWFEKPLQEFLARTPSLAWETIRVTGEMTAEQHHEHERIHFQIAALSTVVALSGIGLAAFFYLGDRKAISKIARGMQAVRLYQLSSGKFYFDQIYQVLFVWPLRLLAAISYAIDRWLVDGLVNLCGYLPRVLGSALRNVQSGLVQFYALAMVIGVVVLLGSLIVWNVG